ncbi:L-proline amide hydrolase [Friedmanniella endophytica]|uniref:Proline iminopeptidase n=1 Tax=Microlunatus kandeliicorticis TaxID=1759536 RepID=A0A7W3P462_9ACTN|nr:proline iminopeptidase-family hydrolase [Microlunatus kandeliicorticis]MBA8792552.1 L-proline amide hydrolase [Microlunatus kandeliicorticis]
MATPEVRTGTVDFDGHQTWYRVTGDLDASAATGKPPVVVLHGGPGAAHNYCLAMTGLADDGRAVVHYDQLGCGNSTHLPDADPGFWTVDLFVREFRNLVGALGIERFHLLGQSWGGMLGPEVVLADDTGVASLSICDSPASMALWLEAANTLREQLPPEVQRTLLEHEAAGTTDSQEYVAAMDVFYGRHVCRARPVPPEVTASFAQIDDDPTVYHTMNGPSEFHVVGSLKEWSVVDRLDGIRVPTLVVAGAYDEAMPIVWQPFLDRIADVRSHVFAGSSHMPHVEEPEEFTRVVGGFLREHDPH